LSFAPPTKCTNLLAIMSAVAQSKPVSQGVSVKLGNPKTSEAVISALRKARYEGKSLREISRQFSLSVRTICRYTKGIQPITPKKTNNVEERWQQGFKESDQIKSLPIKDLSKIYRSIEEFILSKPSILMKDFSFRHLSSFFNWVKATCNLTMEDPGEITLEHGICYLKYLQGQDHSKAMMKRYFSTLSSYGTFCQTSGYSSANHLATITTPRVERRRIGDCLIRPDELKKILSYAREIVKSTSCIESKARAHRNFIGIFLLSKFGMNLNSLLSIRVKDINKIKDRTFLTMQANGDDEYSLPWGFWPNARYFPQAKYLAA
jgi:hypothetical protein